MRSAFGKFNPAIDEGMHAVLSALVAWGGYAAGLDLSQALAVFAAGIAIDLDHLLNPFIARRFLKVGDAAGGVIRGAGGYVIKVFHGIDVALLASIILGYFFGPLFAAFAFASLLAHMLWDFIVYPFKASEFFLYARMKARFLPGERGYLVGRIFDKDTLRF